MAVSNFLGRNRVHDDANGNVRAPSARGYARRIGRPRPGRNIDIDMALSTNDMVFQHPRNRQDMVLPRHMLELQTASGPGSNPQI